MSTLFYIQASWQRKAFKYDPPSQQLTWHNHDKGNFKTSHSVIHIQRQIRFFKRSPFRYNSENVVLRSHMYITLYKWSRKLVFGSLSAMCTASGDVGWFSIKHKSQGQHLYVKHGTSVQRRVFFCKQIYTMHSILVYTPVHRHQINKWCVTKSILETKF